MFVFEKIQIFPKCTALLLSAASFSKEATIVLSFKSLFFPLWPKKLEQFLFYFIIKAIEKNLNTFFFAHTPIMWHSSACVCFMECTSSDNYSFFGIQIPSDVSISNMESLKLCLNHTETIHLYFLGVIFSAIKDDVKGVYSSLLTPQLSGSLQKLCRL